jgi:hypothetical protein
MRRIACLCAITVLVACGGSEDPVISTVNPTPVGQYQAGVTGLPASPGAAGMVNVTAYVSYFIAEASFTGLAPATTYQWKTYFGTCAAKLTQLGPTANPSAYPAVTTDASGAGSARATVVGRFKQDSTYNIRVYTTPAGTTASPDTTFYACGDVQRR